MCSAAVTADLRWLRALAGPEFRRAEQQRLGLSRTRDADVLGTMVFLHRLAIDRDNGRPRGRAFLDFVRGFYPPQPSPFAPASSSLIIP